MENIKYVVYKVKNGRIEGDINSYSSFGWFMSFFVPYIVGIVTGILLWT